MNENCPICKRPDAEISGHELARWGSQDDRLFPKSKPLLNVECLACRKYKIDEKVAGDVATSKSDQNRYVLSAAIREKNENGIDVCVTSLDELRTLYASVSALGALDRIIDYVDKKSPSADVGTSMHPDYEAPVALAKSQSEFEYFLLKAIEGKYIEDMGQDTARQCKRYRLDIEGLKRLPELERVKKSLD